MKNSNDKKKYEKIKWSRKRVGIVMKFLDTDSKIDQIYLAINMENMKHYTRTVSINIQHNYNKDTK